MCVRVGFNSGIKCVKNQRIVIAVSDNKGDNPAVIQIQNGTEINLVYGWDVGFFIDAPSNNACHCEEGGIAP